MIQTIILAVLGLAIIVTAGAGMINSRSIDRLARAVGAPPGPLIIPASTEGIPVNIPLIPDVTPTAPLTPLPNLDPTDHDAFPGLTQRSDGQLVLTWRNASTHTSDDGLILDGTSHDLGRTYSPAELVLGDNVDLRDPSPAVVDDKICLTYFTANPTNPAAGAYLRRDITNSDQEPVRIDAHLYRAAITAPVVPLDDDEFTTELAAVFYGRTAGEQHDSVYFAISHTAGTTWTTGRILDGQAAGRDYQEPWLVRRDGMLHVLYRDGTWDGIGMISAAQNDSGEWSAPRRILDHATGRPTTLVFASGLMLVIYRHTDTRAAVMATSRDGGRTWRRAGVLLSPPGPLGMTYAAMAEVLPGVAHVVVAGEEADGSSRLWTGWLAEVQR